MKIPAYTLNQMGAYILVTTILFKTSYPYLKWIHEDINCLTTLMHQTQPQKTHLCPFKPSYSQSFKINVIGKSMKCKITIKPGKKCYQFYKRHLENQQHLRKVILKEN